MCRVFGFHGESSADVTALIRALLLVEAEDNPHGTGIVIKRGGKNLLCKKGVQAHSFLVKGYADFLWGEKYQYALGHVRFMTNGEQTDRNAHPFGFRVHGKWHFGIHNGVILRDAELADEFGVRVANVDSETLFRCIAVLQNKGHKVVDAIERVTHFVSSRGNFALAYMTESEIFLWRDNQRPLWVFDCRKHGMGMFFASTPQMFARAWEWACPSRDFSRVSCFETRPYRLYRMAGGKIEVVKDLKHETFDYWSVFLQKENRPDVFGKGMINTFPKENKKGGLDHYI